MTSSTAAYRPAPTRLELDRMTFKIRDTEAELKALEADPSLVAYHQWSKRLGSAKRREELAGKALVAGLGLFLTSALAYHVAPVLALGTVPAAIMVIGGTLGCLKDDRVDAQEREGQLFSMNRAKLDQVSFLKRDLERQREELALANQRSVESMAQNLNQPVAVDEHGEHIIFAGTRLKRRAAATA